MAPASKVSRVISQTQFELVHPIGTDFSGYGLNEGNKWVSYIGGTVEIHNADYSVTDTAIITGINGNIMTIDSALSFTVVADSHFIKFSNYSDQIDAVQLVFAFLSNNADDFSDGRSAYTIL